MYFDSEQERWQCSGQSSYRCLCLSMSLEVPKQKKKNKSSKHPPQRSAKPFVIYTTHRTTGTRRPDTS
jgi:hypothetical protein